MRICGVSDCLFCRTLPSACAKHGRENDALDISLPCDHVGYFQGCSGADNALSCLPSISLQPLQPSFLVLQRACAILLQQIELLPGDHEIAVDLQTMLNNLNTIPVLDACAVCFLDSSASSFSPSCRLATFIALVHDMLYRSSQGTYSKYICIRIMLCLNH